MDVIRVGVIPDLNLRGALEVDAAVAVRDELPLDVQFVVAIVFVAGHVQAFAVIDQFAVINLPVLLQSLRLLAKRSARSASGRA